MNKEILQFVLLLVQIFFAVAGFFAAVSGYWPFNYWCISLVVGWFSKMLDYYE